jgi:phenylacetate-CoA ligase
MDRIKSLFIKNIILPFADKAMKTSISSRIKQIELLRVFSKADIENWQNQQLKNLIHHAYYQTEYYKTLFDKIHIKPEEIQTVCDLKRIPVLTKSDIRNNFKELIPANIRDIPHKKASTGGSTGDPMLYLLDNRSWSFSNANNILNWERAGYRYGEKYIALGSTSLFVGKKPSIKHRLYYRFKNKIGLNGVNMSDEVCENYIKLIKRDNINWLYGYASAIYILAEWSIKAGETVNIKGCFTTSEVLTRRYRKTISRAFKCKIVDCYGAHDGGITAFAHEEGFFEVNYNSLVRIEKFNEDGYGPALLTDLLNYAMPFINYELGDELLIDEKLNEQYSYNGQIINKVIGRTSDVLQLGNGHMLTGPGFTILFKDIPVEYYCIEKTASHSIICWIKKLPQFNSFHEETIHQTLKKQAGEAININIKCTESPFLSKSGKRQYMIDNTQ